jgi:hypothetical protein
MLLYTHARLTSPSELSLAKSANNSGSGEAEAVKKGKKPKQTLALLASGDLFLLTKP